MFAAELVERFHDLQWRHFLFLSVGAGGHGDAIAGLETQRDILGLVRGVLGRDAQLVHLARLRRTGVEPRVFEDAALERDVQKVAVHRIRLLRARGDGDVMLLGEGDHLRAPRELLPEAFLPPGRDHLDFRRERGGGQLETHLVVTLAGGPVGDGLGTFGAGNLHHALGDERAGDARAEKVLAFVNRPGLDHRKDEVPGEFLTQVVDLAKARAGGERFRFQSVEFFLLADVRAESDDFRAVGFLEPTQQDGGIQPARICDDDFHIGCKLEAVCAGQKRKSENICCNRRRAGAGFPHANRGVEQPGSSSGS